MENTMGNDMDSTNPITGFSFINDSLFIDNFSLIHLVFVKLGRLGLKLVRPGRLQSLRLVVTQKKKPHIKMMCGENQNYILVNSTSLTGLVAI